MNRIVLSVVCLFVTLCGFAQAHENTTDYVSISALQLIPGEGKDTKSFVVSLEGSQIYTAATMDIVIPEGYEIVFSGKNPKVNNNNESSAGLYPVTNEEEVEEEEANPVYNSHTVSASLVNNQTVRVVVASLSGWSFASTSGKLFRVYVKATPYAKPGYSDVKIENCFFNTEDARQWDTKDLTISDKLSATTSSTLPLTISSDTHWSTCILPFDASIPAGVKAYASDSHDDENVYLTEVQTLKAYTPYILYSENGYSGTMSGTVNANSYPASGYVAVGNLNGAIVNQNISSGYVLQRHGSDFMFYAVDPEKAVTVPAGKCWVTLSDAGASIRNIVITDANGIQSVLSDDDSSEVFNLMGIRVQQPKSGAIYIKNGKKFINK